MPDDLIFIVDNGGEYSDHSVWFVRGVAADDARVRDAVDRVAKCIGRGKPEDNWHLVAVVSLVEIVNDFETFTPVDEFIGHVSALAEGYE